MSPCFLRSLEFSCLHPCFLLSLKIFGLPPCFLLSLFYLRFLAALPLISISSKQTFPAAMTESLFSLVLDRYVSQHLFHCIEWYIGTSYRVLGKTWLWNEFNSSTTFLYCKCKLLNYKQNKVFINILFLSKYIYFQIFLNAALITDKCLLKWKSKIILRKKKRNYCHCEKSLMKQQKIL